MKKLLLIIGIIFGLSGCGKDFQTIALKTSTIGSEKGLKEKIYQTKNFKIFTLQKITDPNKPVRIYFEGDGRAFIGRHTPSTNPTPTSFFLINLVIKDDYPNIVYIARPCQYVADKKCVQKYWTTARFSKEVIDSVDDVVQNFSKYHLELIGYSGGGAVAKYLAARNKNRINLINLRTIAGNLDPQKFAEVHRVSPLAETLSDSNLLGLANIPQIHFVGDKDKIIPQIIARTYRDKLPKKDCTMIVTVKGNTHSKGWDKKWKELLKIQPVCSYDLKESASN